MAEGKNIGFVSTRFAGNDGVSLESAKWAQILWDHKHVSYWYAGRLDRHPDFSLLVPHAYFGHPDIMHINERILGRTTRDAAVTTMVYAISEHLKRTIYEFVERFRIDILCVQNALCIPMNVPLGLALTTFIAETGFPTIAHHHDFYWERVRFSINAMGDFLAMAFPPALPSIQHVTINTSAQEALSHRTGQSSVLVPNVLEFEAEPPEPDEYVLQLRSDIGIEPEDILFLQPTRVVPRKGIEHSIALVAALHEPRCKLVISHETGDEGIEYRHALTEIASAENVDLRFVEDRLGEVRGVNERGERTYTLADFYSQADFITYPSLYEGFGNALLEAFYYRRPVLVNRYSIFITDIEPRGFEVITMDGYLTRDVVAKVKRVIQDDDFRATMVNNNYELGRKFFSYSILRRKLRSLITNITGLDEL